MCQTRRFKRFFAVILVLCMAFGAAALMTACGSGGAVDPEISADVSDSDLVGKRVDAPVDSEFFTANNIEIKKVDISTSDMFTGEYVEVSGLKNTEVQDKINTLIKETVENAMAEKNPPPYRGAQLKVKQYKGEDGSLNPTQYYVSADAIGNVNNVLSIEVYKNVYYGDSEGDYDESAWFNEIIPLNIDLNTGEELKLQDFFADNVDGLEYVNRYVGKILESYDYENEETFLFTDQYDTKLTGPFKGFDEDVNFSFSSSTGNISIILDYKTPEFYVGDTGTSFSKIVIPYSEYMGFTEKFMTEESLFTDENPAYLLVTGSHDQSLLHRENDDENVEGFNDNVMVYGSFGYYEDQDKDFVEYARSIYEGFDEKDDYIKAVKECKTENNDVFGFLRYGVDCMNAGKYNCIQCFCEKMIETAEDDCHNTVLAESSAKYITLNPDTGKPMKVEDLFKTGDPEEALIKAMMENMKEQEEYLEEGFEWSENMEEYLRAMIKEINGFSLNSESIDFSYNSDPLADAADYIQCDPEFLYHYSNLVNSVSYKAIGCENLIIFG